MIKKITTCILLAVSMFTFAQQGTASPYSYFGIGETKFKGTPEQKAMGGLGILPDSIHLNLLNPASYSSLQLTTISLSGSASFSNQITNDEKGKAQRTSLEYLAFGIPMGKFGAAFGINPQTSVGYRIESISDSDSPSLSQYTGEGGSNRVFAGGAYQISDNFSVGLDANYYFGNVTTISKLYTSGAQLGTRIDNDINLSGLSFNLGLMYKAKVNEKYNIYTSATYSPSYNLTIKSESLTGTVGVNQNGNEYYDDISPLRSVEQKYSMPSRFSVGGGFGEFRKWLIGTELAFTGKSEINSPISGSFSNFKNTNAIRTSIGGYYIPKYNSFNNYFQRVTYRAGVRYENMGLEVNGETITDIGASLGFNLPIGNGFSDLSFAFEYGKRGTKSSNLVREDYFNVTIAISITDRWFRKFLYD